MASPNEYRHSTVFAISDDEVNVNGHRLRAFETGIQRLACNGCEFIDGFGCALSSSLAMTASIANVGQEDTRCISRGRSDGKHIVWKLYIPANFPQDFPGTPSSYIKNKETK